MSDQKFTVTISGLDAGAMGRVLTSVARERSMSERKIDMGDVYVMPATVRVRVDEEKEGVERDGSIRALAARLEDDKRYRDFVIEVTDEILSKRAKRA